MKAALGLAALLAVTGMVAAAPGRAQANGRPVAPTPSSKSILLPPDNAMARLKPGPGVQAVESNCSICHSTDYIVRQPGGDAQHWEPEVRKMAKVFGAPLSEADIQTIVQYLASKYGPAASAPAQPQKPVIH